MGVDEARLRRRAAIAEAYQRVVNAPRVEVSGITILATSLEAVVAQHQDGDAGGTDVGMATRTQGPIDRLRNGAVRS